MRLILERSGGQIPTYRPRYVIEAEGLPTEERRALEALLLAANFFRLPDRFNHRPIPDAFQYKLTVQHGEHTHTVIFHDQDGHPETLDDLVEWITEKGE